MPDGGGGGDTTSLAEARVKIVLHGVGNWSLWKRFYYPNKWLSSLSIFFSLQLHAPYIPMPPQLFHSGPTSTAISRVNFLLLPCLPFTLRHYFPILSLLNSLTFLITTVNLPPPSPLYFSRLSRLSSSPSISISLSLSLSPRLGRRRSPDYCSVAFSKTGSKLHGHSSRANEPRIGRKARHATISTNSQREEERKRRGEDKTRIGKVEGSVHCAAANEPRVPSRANLWRKCSNSHTTPCSRRNLPPSFSSSTSPRRRSRRRAKCHRFRPLLNRESRRGRGWKGRRRGKKDAYDSGPLKRHPKRDNP